MKRTLIILFLLIHIANHTKAQVHNNELGLSAGSFIWPDEIGSIFYTNVDYHTFFPKIYFSTRINKKWKWRLNVQHIRYKRKLQAQEIYLHNIGYPPGPHEELVSLTKKDRTTDLATGFQFNLLKRKKTNLYAAADAIYRFLNGSSYYKLRDTVTGQLHGLRRNNDPNLISYSVQARFPSQSPPIRPYRDPGLLFALHLGAQYLISPIWSASYEISLHTALGVVPISRLSLNYHFKT